MTRISVVPPKPKTAESLLARGAEAISTTAGTVLFREGDRDGFLAIVVTGALEIRATSH